MGVGIKRSIVLICQLVILTTGKKSDLSKVIIYLCVSIISPFLLFFVHSTVIIFWSTSASVSSSIVELDFDLLTTVLFHL